MKNIGHMQAFHVGLVGFYTMLLVCPADSFNACGRPQNSFLQLPHFFLPATVFAFPAASQDSDTLKQTTKSHDSFG